MLKLKNEKIDLIKIGGSVITNKSKYKTLREEQLECISKEIAQWDRKCIIIHGAGSFGHIIADQYSIHHGFDNQDQLKGILQIRTDMNELSEIVKNKLIKSGIQALNFQTSSIVFETVNGFFVYTEPLEKALSLGLYPVLSGDVLFTENNDFGIISGDVLAYLLSQKITIGRVIFITDVDGLYVQDNFTKEKELVKSISLENLETLVISELNQVSSKDVTGGMQGKISEIKKLLEYVSEVILVNGFHPERLASIRKGEDFIGTRLINKNST